MTIIISVFFKKNDSKSDKGRFETTRDEADLGKFKTPSLRNIALSSPYFHDGREKNLRDIIELYNKANPMGDGDFKDPKLKAIHLDEKEMFQLQEFLHALSSTDELLSYVKRETIDSIINLQRYPRERFEERYYIQDFDSKLNYFLEKRPVVAKELKLDKISALNESELRKFKIEVDEKYFRGKYKELFSDGEYLIFNQN
jgi:hypothetical protein